MNNELKHYGILGMKWGRRKGSSKKQNPDIKRRKDMKKAVKNRRLLSDDELVKRIGRLEKEKKLRELTDSEIGVGRNKVTGILADAGKKAATTMVAGATLYAVKAAMTKKFDLNDAANYITPKPKNK